MPIIYYENNKIFHLYNEQMSYVMQIVKDNYLAHLYYGKRIDLIEGEFELELRERVAFSPTPDISDLTFSLDHLPQEYPGFGTSDFRTPAFEITDNGGDFVADFRVVDYKIFSGKTPLTGLPGVIGANEELTSLEIVMEDALTKVQVVLSYTIFNHLSVLSRSTKFVNNGINPITLRKVASFSFDLPTSDFDFIHLYGGWGKERHIERTKLINGIQAVESKRGVSSHQHNPFIALAAPDCTEDSGHVYGASLVYSGSFKGLVEVDQFETARVMMGINDFQFSWKLTPGATFQSPECILVFSDQGLGKMSRTYHDLYRNHLVKSTFKDKERPVLINNWEATYFDFTSEKLVEIAKAGKKLGMEQFVLDDGWFGKRDNDDSSLGDWFVDERKIPEGMKALSEEITNLGIGFGLWVEPEMVSPNSELYQKHPDWCVHIQNRPRTEARQQLVLDLSRTEVQDYIIGFMDKLLSENKINYVKWDMNRPLTEMGSACLASEQKGELQHRYVLGLYRVLDTITKKHPHVLFESCSGGGGRFDPGMFQYMPQAWTSDDSDAVERLKIQYGTSLVYPLIFMGAHVSDVPNHQVFRSPLMKMRGDVAYFGNLGYEIDLTAIDDETALAIEQQVTYYKEIRHILHHGDFYRIVNPFTTDACAWMMVSKNQNKAVLGYYQPLVKPNAQIVKMMCKGLEPKATYLVKETNKQYKGSYLMEVGLVIPTIKGDYNSYIFTLKQV